MSPRFVLFGFVFVVFVLNDSGCAKSDKKNASVFVPTRKWQKVKEGQTLPPGLHVRMNLQTGEKEAKLLDDEVEDKKKALVTTRQEGDKSDEGKNVKADRFSKILEKVKADEVQPDKEALKKFRSYDEIKKDFSKMQIEVKTDMEILTGLIQTLRKLYSMKIVNSKNPDAADDEVILTALVDLEYLVHQYDNALEFAKLNGFPDVIYKSLNSSNSEIRAEALRLLGSATQSNPKVQIAAINSGSIHLLLKVLTFDDDVDVRSRSLFALSCLIRRFPAGQAKLIADGGLTAFAKVFDERKLQTVKLQIKIITLIHDLLFERKDAKMNILEEESRNKTDLRLEALREQLKEYEEMDLEKKLVEQDWCKRISNWFIDQNYKRDLSKNLDENITLDTVNLETHDVIEKVVDTLYVLSDICKTEFESDILFMKSLFVLRDIYSNLSVAELKKNDDDSNQFYTSLSNILKMLTDKLKRTPKKDEL